MIKGTFVKKILTTKAIQVNKNGYDEIKEWLEENSEGQITVDERDITDRIRVVSKKGQYGVYVDDGHWVALFKDNDGDGMYYFENYTDKSFKSYYELLK